MGTKIFFQMAIDWQLTLQNINLVAQILGVIFILIYVYYTYQSFKQIKKQTDYQQDAYLRICTMILKDIPPTFSLALGTGLYSGGQIQRVSENYNLTYINNEFHDKLKGILRTIFNFEDTVFDGNYYTLIFTNYGNSPIKEISLKLDITIRNSKALVDRRMLKESEHNEIQITIDEILTRDGEIKVPIISTAAFPIYTIVLTGSYLDVRNKKYDISQITYSGDNEHLKNLT